MNAALCPSVVNYGTKLLSVLRFVTGYLSKFLVANTQHCACKCAAGPLLATAYRYNYRFHQTRILPGQRLCSMILANYCPLSLPNLVSK